MKRLFLVLFCLSVTACAFAQPAGYYNSTEGLTGNELKLALHNIIKGHHKITYSQIWDAFWSTDNKGNGIVWDMYSNQTFHLGSDECGTYDNEGDCYNREHSWPQSWFNDQSTPRCDLHHIFATDGYVNNRRGNNPFGEVSSATYTSSNGSKLGQCKTSGYSGVVFEPINQYKGDLARAIMYMSVRYYKEDSGWGSSGMTNKSEIKPWAIAMLLRWHQQDPVSQKEIDRNNVIYEDYQYNRNPFIDNPEFAFRIWDPNWTDFCVEDTEDLQSLVFPNPVDKGGELHFAPMSQGFDKVSVCDLSGRAILQMCATNETDFDLALPEGLQSGFYILQLQQEGRVVGTLKLVVK